MATGYNTQSGFLQGGTFFDDNSPLDIGVTVGAEAGDVINVAIQLRSTPNDNLSSPSKIFAYLSDVATGTGFTATAPPNGVSIGTNGEIIQAVANVAFDLVSNASGQIDIDIDYGAGAKSYWLVILNALGVATITPVTFAA
jgi:hypothetical protein